MSSLPETKFPSALGSVLSLLISSNAVYCLGCYDHIYNKFYFSQDMCPVLGATHVYVLQNLCSIDIPITDAKLTIFLLVVRTQNATPYWGNKAK